MRLVDAHCHLEKDAVPEPGPVLERAREAGLIHAVVIGQWHAKGDFGAALQVARAHPEFLTATMGIHPHNAAEVDEEELETLARLCALPEVAAVGEAGLDFYYDSSPRQVQKEVFRRQCQLSRQVNKPLVLHIRDAHREALAILKDEGVEGGVVHCFTGDTDDARGYLERGFVISLSGILTYKKTEPLQDAARFTPLDALLVETDSPYLAPVPLRGKRNEPANLVHTARKLAELKGLDPELLAEATSRNAARVFGFKLD